MEYKIKKLENGLTIVGEITKETHSAAVGFFVKTGARDESSEISGVSHFLEHMIFKGTEKLSALEVNLAFDRVGAQFNAFTSEENTVYHAGVLPEYMLEVSALWAQLMRPSLRDEDFNIEKNVILQEIAMYKDMPQFDVYDKARALHFGDHPCGNSVLGTEESIKALSAQQMKDYFWKTYSPGNIRVVACGNYDWDAFCEVIEENCGDWKPAEISREISFYNGSLKTVTEERASLVREHICMMHPTVAAQDEERHAARMLSLIIGDDTGSRYFWELIDTANAEVANMCVDAMDGVGALYSYFRCSKDNAPKVLEIVSNIFREIEKNGIKDEELITARNKVLSSITLKNELPMGRLFEVGFNQTYLEIYNTVEEEIAAVKSVTREQVVNLITRFDLEKHTSFILAPEK